MHITFMNYVTQKVYTCTCLVRWSSI